MVDCWLLLSLVCRIWQVSQEFSCSDTVLGFFRIISSFFVDIQNGSDLKKENMSGVDKVCRSSFVKRWARSLFLTIYCPQNCCFPLMWHSSYMPPTLRTQQNHWSGTTVINWKAEAKSKSVNFTNTCTVLVSFVVFFPGQQPSVF